MKQNKPKVLLIGWDAADWKVINPLMDKGELPAIENLVNNGVMGNLSTLEPPFSPMLWTTIATGKRPDKHGILGFTEPNPDQMGVRPVSNRSRKVKAIWNILNQKDYKSHVVGWWPSHPAEPINGIMISNHYQHFTDKDSLPENCIHPKELTGLFSELKVKPTELTEAHILPFVPEAAKIDQDSDKRLENIIKNIAEASSIHAATTWIMENQDWDFMAVYLDTIDHFCHGFMNYHPPKMRGVKEDDFSLYKDVINGAYRFHDMMLERLLAIAGEETTIILVSDHGFHSDHLRPDFIPGEAAGPAAQHRQHGIICMKGPGIKKDERIYGASLLNITPTLLSLFGLPIGEDMDGAPLIQAFSNPSKIETISSWEDVQGESGMLAKNLQDNPLDAAIELQQLIDLGYIEDPGENKKEAAQRAARENRYNLARVLIGAQRYLDAIPILTELYNEDKTEPRISTRLAKCYNETSQQNMSLEIIADAEIHINKSILSKDEVEKLIELRKSSSEKNKQKKDRNINLKLRINHDKELSILTLSLLRADALLTLNNHESALEILNNINNNLPNRTSIMFHLANAYLKLGKWELAEEFFKKIIVSDPENGQALHGLAIVALRTRKYEQAIDFALDSIALVYQNPLAHFHLGEALMLVEEFEHAAQAFEVCLKMYPDLGQARNFLIEIYEKHIINEERADYHKAVFNTEAKTFRYNEQVDEGVLITETYGKKKFENPITIVSGLPRSGTSMMMQMLEAGGFDIYTDKKREADISNPKGYYEHENVMKLARDKKWLSEVDNKAVKIISHLLFHLPHNYNYKIIFMLRDIKEVVYSQHKMLINEGKAKADTYPMNLELQFKKNLQKVRQWNNNHYNTDILFLNYHEVLEKPKEAAMSISKFLDKKFSIDKMSEIADKQLYRNKNQ